MRPAKNNAFAGNGMRLIIGRAGTGKNRFIMEEIERTASAEKRAVLIVPEQSSFSLEKRLYFLLGARRSGYVAVRSFSRLAGDILSASGAAAKLRATDAAKAALVRRAVAALGDSLSYYRRNHSDSAFFNLAAGVIGECKNAAITPAFLFELAEQSNKKLTGTKLRELASIYEIYETLFAELYEDEADHISAAAERVSQIDFFFGKTVYIDGFTGFTEPEYSLIKSMAARAKEIVVTLLGDPGGLDANALFSAVDRSAFRLIDIFEETGRNTDVVPLHEKTVSPPGIPALERYLAGEEAGEETEGVFLIEAADPYEELEKAAAEIIRLVREEDYRFSDIALITRDVERYRAMIRRTFRLFGIPYYADWTENETFSPAAVFIRTALALLDEFTAENLLALLKTSLTSVSAEETASFEDYIFVWSVGGDELKRAFTNHPDGLSERESEQSSAKLAEAEAAREKVVGWVMRLMDDTRGKSAGEVVKGIYLLMQSSGAVQTLTRLGAAGGAFQLLEQLYHILGNDVMRPSEIAGIAETLFFETFTGEIPDTLEQVQVGAAARIRTGEPKAVFVIGLNEGIFPQTEFDSPLLSFAEREYINEKGGKLARDFDNLTAMEELHLYNALTSAGERVYLSFPAAAVTGEMLQPSAVIEGYIERFSPPRVAEDVFARIVNEATAKKAYLEDAGLREEMRRSGYFEFCERLDAAARAPVFAVADASLLTGASKSGISLSPSQIERFSGCRFAYFLQYAARIRPLAKVELSPLQAGNFIHAVMERVFSEIRGDIASVGAAELRALCDEAADSYTAGFLKEAAEKSPLIRYQAERLKAQSRRLAACMGRELSQSLFRPADFELAIGDGGIPPRVIPLEDGTSVSVRGKIDRVDIAETDTERYVRVVDYKTGERDFSLDDVYYGLNLQMLIYLFSVVENGVTRYGELTPAGVLYMPSDPPVESSGASAKAYRMDGMIVSDPKIVGAMEKDAAGVFIPARLKNGAVSGAEDQIAGFDELENIKQHVDGIIAGMAKALKAGSIEAKPAVKGRDTPCDWCEYTAVCLKDRIVGQRLVEKGACRLLKGGADDD